MNNLTDQKNIGRDNKKSDKQFISPIVITVKKGFNSEISNRFNEN